jgi:hypothetical protein
MKRLTYGMLAMVLLLTAVPALQADELDFLSADGGICPASSIPDAGIPEPILAALPVDCFQCSVCSSDRQCGGTAQGLCLPITPSPCSPTSTGKACYCR